MGRISREKSTGVSAAVVEKATMNTEASKVRVRSTWEKYFKTAFFSMK
jgi:hypothetical protein